MSDRSVNVRVNADVSTYLDAMKTANEATDALRDSLKELRKEQREYATEAIDTSWTGGEIAEAVFSLLDEGVSRDDIQRGALTATLVLAGSTASSTKDSGKITGIAARRFKLSGPDLRSVADIAASD